MNSLFRKSIKIISCFFDPNKIINLLKFSSQRDNITIKSVDDWMKLSKEERYYLNSQERITKMKENKIFLKEIRKEYSNIKKNRLI
tara:strand:- start:4646 stop:4903 length:258 start_codon:yes stop_codon:yes gene_type:complete